MNREIWDEKCSRGIFGLVLAILVFTPLAFGGEGSWQLVVVQALAIGVAALWAVRLWTNPKPQFLWPPIAWAALAFLLYAIGRYLTTEIEYAARLEFLKVLVCTLLFLAILNNLYHQDLIQTISYVLITVAVLGSSCAVAQHLTHSTRVWNIYALEVGRSSGTFMSADHFCAFLEMLIPLALAILLAGRVKALTRVLLGYSLLAMLAGVAVTFSRAGYIATVVGLLVVLLILIGHRNHRLIASVILLFLTAGGFIFVTRYLSQSLTYLQRVQSADGQLNTDIFIRTKIWLAGWHMWLDHLWWGVGPGGFNWYWNEYRPQSVQTRAGWTHCDYLNLLDDWGLVGGLIVLTAIVLCLAGIAFTWRRVRRSEADFGSRFSNRFAIFLGCLGGLAAIAVHSTVDFDMHVLADELLALALLAMLTSNLRFATERYWWKIRLPMKLAATAVLLAVAGYLGWQTIRLGGQAWHLAQAANIPGPGLARAVPLESAFQAEPRNFENAFAIGECYSTAAAQGATNVVELLDTANHWYQTSQRLNPHHSVNYLRQGINLDLLGRYDEAQVFYDEADAHDPNGFSTTATIGWHYMRSAHYAAARIWLNRSLLLMPLNNPVARSSLPEVEMYLSDDAGHGGF